MSKRDEKLLVSWKGPESKKNYFVGLLSKNNDSNGLNYKFVYNQEIVSQAQKDGFKPFVGLKDLDKEYSSNKLFSIFERRLPNQSRNVFKKFINDYSLETSDVVTWEYLKITKGRTATDNLSFLEPVYIIGDNLMYTGEVAGWSFTRQNNYDLKVNDQLVLQVEENNREDNTAVEIINPENENTRVGYIQKPFNKVFFSLLKKGYSLNCYIKSIDSIENRPTISVEKEVSLEDIKDRELDYLIHHK